MVYSITMRSVLLVYRLPYISEREDTCITHPTVYEVGTNGQK